MISVQSASHKKCFPFSSSRANDSPAPWPDCASLSDAKLNDTDTDNGTVYTATLEQCSYDCMADSQVQHIYFKCLILLRSDKFHLFQCNFWQYDDRPKRCTRKTSNNTLLPGVQGDVIYIGPKVREMFCFA